ncbi:Guanine exchange factor for Rac 30 [Pelomyxa schiedti]|nr:Guanine exchange factor for Rac 30 [Pelomyxa schiedti]
MSQQQEGATGEVVEAAPSGATTTTGGGGSPGGERKRDTASPQHDKERRKESGEAASPRSHSSTHHSSSHHSSKGGHSSHHSSHHSSSSSHGSSPCGSPNVAPTMTLPPPPGQDSSSSSSLTNTTTTQTLVRTRSTSSSQSPSPPLEGDQSVPPALPPREDLKSAAESLSPKNAPVDPTPSPSSLEIELPADDITPPPDSIEAPGEIEPPPVESSSKNTESAFQQRKPSGWASSAGTNSPRQRMSLLGVKDGLSRSSTHIKSPLAATDIQPPPIPPPPVILDDSWKTKVPPEVSEKLPAMLKRRHQIANEMLLTETSYLKSLVGIVESFVVPMKTDLKGLVKEDVFHLFANTEVIKNCHVKLHQAISDCLSNWQDSSVLGSVFLSNTTFIKLYKYYVNNHETACSTLTQCKEKSPTFRQYLERLEYTPALNNLNVEGLLITPVQRVPRYVLLLTDMLKSTPKEHPDNQPLQDALEFMRDLADYINQRKHDSDNMNELNEIESKLANFEGGLTSNSKRRFIKEGVLSVNRTKSRVWLFSDMILITKPDLKRNKYTFQRKFLLAAASLQTDDGPTSSPMLLPSSTASPPVSTALSSSTSDEFKLLCSEGTMKFVAQTPEERQVWVKEIRKILEEIQNNLMQSLFNNTVSGNVEGSKKYWEALEADNEKKRAALVQRLIDTESQYVSILTSTFKTFIVPLRESLKIDTCPLMQEQGLQNVTLNFETLIAEHEQFLVEIQERQKDWEGKGTITDLFESRLVKLSALYSEYVSHHSDQMRTLETAHIGNPQYSKWLAETEELSKIVLKIHLSSPLKRVSEYYLLCQEMLQSTIKKHPDFEALNKLVASLKMLTDDINRSSVKSAASTASPQLRRVGSKNLL